MFRENTLHRQEKLFINLSAMDPRYKKRLCSHEQWRK